MNKLPWVLALVLGLSFTVLMVAFRSLFLPLKAIVMNLLSIGAAFGLLVLVFQEGAGEKIFNFHSTGTIQIYLPLLAFALLFGLSMDYEVFLIGRMKEEWKRTRNNNLAVEHGLEHTARVITSAAAIMVTIFGAFTFTSVLEIKQLGFALAVAVLVDATLIRIVLVPAAMQVMGRWNWYLPRFLQRILPPVDL
jgi:RND superfamily putative drug exporter